ncbi:MAG: amidohydrolase [Sphingomonadaceae bacterium]|nr:amidohydrolase [Sphingomonadaceae bacterium]
MAHEKLIEDAQAIAGELVTLRRAIHAEPELGLHTPKTRDKVRTALAHLPLEWTEGASTTGVVAVLKGGAGEGRSVLLRGDMDALPMPEETGLDFASCNEGVMHACGHDAHTAMLAGAAELLARRAETLKGEVRFMFQPGEEGHHGARYMIEDGLLGGKDGLSLPDAAFALHVFPNAPHGVFGGRPGSLLAAADQFRITITGKGGHASLPHETMDPIPIACEIVSALQAMVTRKFSVFDPVVLTVARIEAGTTFNVVPDKAEIEGTMRSLSSENRARLREQVQRIAAGVAGAHELTADIEIVEGFPVTVCDEQAVSLGERVAGEIFGEGAFLRLDDPIMGAEDFAYVLEKVPGAMFFLGVSHEGEDWTQCCGIHSTRMMIDESVMPRGVAMLAGVAEAFLARGFD